MPDTENSNEKPAEQNSSEGTNEQTHEEATPNQETPKAGGSEAESSNKSEADKEVSRLEKKLSDARKDAARYRTGKREVVQENESLAQKFAELESRFNAREAEFEAERVSAAREIAVRDLGLDPARGEQLGTTVEQIQQSVSLLSEFRSGQASTPPPRNPSGGNNPRNSGETFDADSVVQSLLSNARRR